GELPGGRALRDEPAASLRAHRRGPGMGSRPALLHRLLSGTQPRRVTWDQCAAPLFALRTGAREQDRAVDGGAAVADAHARRTLPEPPSTSRVREHLRTE